MWSGARIRAVGAAGVGVGGTLGTFLPVPAVAPWYPNYIFSIETDNPTYTTPLYPVGDPQVTQALQDLGTARAWCTAQPNQQALAGLAGQTLSAGVYSISGSALLGGAAGTAPLRLIGTATDVFILNVTGDFVADADAWISLEGLPGAPSNDAVRPGNVFWNINGHVQVYAGVRVLAGVLMTGGDINFNGPWHGTVSALAQGSFFYSTNDLVSTVHFPSPYWLQRGYVGRRPNEAPLDGCATTNTPPNPATTCPLLVPDGYFEEHHAPRRPRHNLTNRHLNAYWPSDAEHWESATSDYADLLHRRSASGTEPVDYFLSFPYNVLNNFTSANYIWSLATTAVGGVVSQQAHTVAGTAFRPVRSYLVAPLTTPLVVGKAYYAEFFSLHAARGGWAVNKLGLDVLDQPFKNTDIWGQTPWLGTGANTPSVSAHDGNFAATTTWSRTAGCFQATTAAQFITIGDFGNDQTSGFTAPATPSATEALQGAYYYVTRVRLVKIPEPLVTRLTTQCQNPVEYTVDLDCDNRPTGAVYTWHEGNANGPTPSWATGAAPYTATVSSTTAYTLVVTVPRVDGGNADRFEFPFELTGPPVPPPPGYCELTNKATKVIKPNVFPAQGTPYYSPPLTNGSFTFQAARYHVTCPIVLGGSQILSLSDYEMAPGCELLFDPATSLTVDKGARLTVRASRLTAACDQQWEGILVGSKSRGLLIGRAADSFTTPLPAAGQYGEECTESEISHAAVAIRWNRPDLTPLHLLHTLFWCNLTDVQTGPLPANLIGENVPPAAAASVLNCRFDGASAHFKKGYPTNWTEVYALAHLDFGDWNPGPMPVAGNYFGHALLGIHADLAVPDAESRSFNLLLEANAFEACYVAGVYIDRLEGTLAVEGKNRFQFAERAFLSQPPLQPLWTDFLATYKRVAENLQDPLTGLQRTAGVAVPKLRSDGSANLRVVGKNTFVQDEKIADFTDLGDFPQIGILTNEVLAPYQIEDNIFLNLAEGVRLGDLGWTGANSTFLGNRFTDCGTGLTTYNQSGASAGVPYLWARCNTFERTILANGSPNWGILMEGTLTRIIFDDLTASGGLYSTPMKNRFTGPERDRMTWLESRSLQGAPRYVTYSVNSSALGTPVDLVGDIMLRSQGFDVNSGFMIGLQDYTDGQDCASEGLPNAGIQPLRPGKGETATPAAAPAALTAALHPASPNPTATETTIGYALPDKCQQAEIVLRDLLTGQARQRVVLDTRAQSATLRVAHLPAGVYSYTLLVEGAAVATRRLLITR